MARDYKSRAAKKSKQKSKYRIINWQWLLIIFLIVGFVFFLVNLTDKNRQNKQQKLTIEHKKATNPKSSYKQKNKKLAEPYFDFYTILPETEVIIPEYEINTRNREEQFGKPNVKKYLLQAGSFKEPAEADKLRAILALIGIESKIEQAKVGNTVWNRVKIGPYSRSSDVFSIRNRLRKNNIDAIVVEIKGY